MEDSVDPNPSVDDMSIDADHPSPFRKSVDTKSKFNSQLFNENN